MTDYERWERPHLEKMMDAAFPVDMVPCIQRFFEQVHPRLEPKDGLCEEVFFTDLFFPLQRQAELRRMLQIAGSPKVVAEIGADKGGGVYHWCQLPSVKKVIACEVRGLPYAKLFEQHFPEVRFHWLPCSSHENGAVASTSRFLGQDGIDCLFIDGDKSRFLVDFNAWLPLMNPRGVVFFHDVNEPGQPMKTAFERAAQGRRSEVIIDLSDTERALGREKMGLPPSCPHEGLAEALEGAQLRGGSGVVVLR